VLFSRFAVEITMLIPVLVFAGISMAIKSFCTGSELTATALMAGSGFTLGLATYNHIIASAIALSIFVSGLFLFKTKLLKSTAFWIAGKGL
jgi:hypothetical protein